MNICKKLFTDILKSLALMQDYGKLNSGSTLDIDSFDQLNQRTLSLAFGIVNLHIIQKSEHCTIYLELSFFVAHDE
jgi:hypothetical protein